MLALLQRVTHAKVEVNNQIVGEINQGLLIFIGIEKSDTTKKADRLLERILGYRVFADNKDRMNLTIKDINGGLLFVPQFTLVADTKKGMRPSFTSAADPVMSDSLFSYLTQQAKTQYHNIATGQFAANMQVHLCNNGPVTFILKV